MTLGLGLVIGAVVCFTVAAASIVFNATNPDIYPLFVVAGLGLGFTGVKLP